MIPQYYRSQAAPISSQVLWNETTASTEVKDPFSVGYVVYIFNAYYPCEEEVLNVFHFTHPAKEVPKNMFKKITYISKNSALIHGFAGFFETQLYDKVWLSTKPDTHTPGMMSWFPMYFPVNKPINVNKGSKITLSIWRLTKSYKIWYEWRISVEDNVVSHTLPSLHGASQVGVVDSDIHNSNGESYWIGSTI